MQDLGPRIRTPRPSGPRFSLVVVINLDRTILALRISEVTRPDKCITPEIDPVLRGTSKLDTVNKFVNICL